MVEEPGVYDSDHIRKKGYRVQSFGTGDKVKLPGAAPDRPNVYEFGTPYDDIYQDLLQKDRELYTRNGLLHMLDRNRRIKPHPERFQSTSEQFNLILTCEERVYDQVIESLEGRDSQTTPVHIVNIEIQDNHEEATIGAFLMCDLVAMMANSDDLDNDIDEMLQDFEAKCQRPILHCLLFY
uniref:RNA polymerase II subunit A C-terminal domain phosphatase SSU72 n=1 Tax=Daphnia sinensis TaxID=1820382 RepID=A0A4Y7NFM4_9CRUS|nr:EOG090X0E4R [Daphnia sinensis]SVE91416.1 EOG090X0E4R [Daphnia sinensis]